MSYTVGYLRSLGFEAKWTKTRKGRPIILARNPAAKAAHQREEWWAVDKHMWQMAQKLGDFAEAFDNSTLLGDLFSVPL